MSDALDRDKDSRRDQAASGTHVGISAARDVRWLRISRSWRRANGECWADAIGKLKDHASERLNMAKRHLPLPAFAKPQSRYVRSFAKTEGKGPIVARPWKSFTCLQRSGVFVFHMCLAVSSQDTTCWNVFLSRSSSPCH